MATVVNRGDVMPDDLEAERVPRRIKFPRGTRGWRKPPGAVMVTRGPGRRWGNPFRVPKLPRNATREQKREANARAVAAFAEWLETTPAGRELAAAARHVLKGHDLACFCDLDLPCHADVLLEWANRPG